MEEKVLSIEMFGGFQAIYGDTPVVPRESRNSKVLQLWQYLLINRERMVQQEELIFALLDDEECDNPLGVLKNLVYRLRKLLETAGVPRECIRYKKSAYGFFAIVPLWVDEQEFTEHIEHIRQNTDGGRECFDECLAAVEIYRSGFLPRGMGEPWIMGYSVRYQEMYCDCFRRAQKIAKAQGWEGELVPWLQKAVALYPYEEELALAYIDCLYQANYVKKSIEAYEAVNAVLLNDLGIAPTPRMRELYQKITGGLNQQAVSVVEVRSDMVEKEFRKGAFCCNTEVFTNLYRFVVRHMERSGQSVYLMLCTLAKTDGSVPESGSELTRVVEHFHTAAEESLRRGDAYARYSPTQFVLMLMEISQENCAVVADRLRRNFYAKPKMNHMRLTCKSISAADMRIMMDRYEDAGAKW
ncbi:MAG: BTAD domain-containing putative transcriptional regulator [Christensenella sp.]|nr:BTAD domain-containing putative transcriptional regulator [Christensenella sp.]